MRGHGKETNACKSPHRGVSKLQATRIFESSSSGTSMSIKSKPSHRLRRGTSVSLIVVAASGMVTLCGGCQDGPFYALKVANPYFSIREWKRDEELGVTDHERRQQLAKLAKTIDSLPPERQQFWAGHLEQMLEHDESPEMRRLVVQAAGRMEDPAALRLIEQGLDDASVKVRMEACRSLGNKTGDEATRMLVATVGTDTNQDVKHSAMVALSHHKNQIAIDSLRIALSDRNPATRDLAMESLRGVTGKNYGDDPQVWIAALDGKSTEEAPVRFADRIRDLF
jgi:hypothetical protein